jgi:hypothetical protein
MDHDDLNTPPRTDRGGETEGPGAEETLYLLSISGMKDTILEGAKEPVQECAPDLEW